MEGDEINQNKPICTLHFKSSSHQGHGQFPAKQTKIKEHCVEVKSSPISNLHWVRLCKVKEEELAGENEKERKPKGKWRCRKWDRAVCEQPSVPADPLLAGLAAGASVALNSAQAQRGILGNLFACLDNPPSATLWKAPGPSTSLHVGPKYTTYGGKQKWSPSSSEGTKIAKHDSVGKL